MRLLTEKSIQRFNPSILDLGDISKPCQEKEAIAAVFDLSGFTRFCNQVDSYLNIPRFFNDFLNWFFTSIQAALTEEDYGDRSTVWAEFPFFVKFLGDGLLLLWNTSRMTEDQICRIAFSLYEICYAYRYDFYPRMSMAVNKPPQILKCGVARGKVFTIGNDKDYVGHCINNASRLSQIGVLSFCIPHRGFQIKEYITPEYDRIFALEHLSIRGIGENELVWVLREEYEKLTEKNKALIRST